MAVSQSLTLTQSSQSVSGNYSKVRILWTSTQTGESWNGYTRTAYFYVSINGGSETRYSVSYTLPKGSTKTIVDKTITVEHKANGTGSVKVRTYMDTNLSAGVIEQSKSLTLSTIPRATTPSLSASSAYMGADTVTISLPRASSSFTHNLAYKFEGDSSYTSITTGAGASYSWAVPDRSASIPSATSGQFTVRVQTVSGGSVIGTKYVYLTGKVPTSAVPTVSSVSLSEATAGLAAQFGVYVAGKSALNVTVNGAGSKGSTITAYQTLLSGKTFTSRTFNTGLLTSSGTLTMQTRVKDSRGRWSAYKNTSITVHAYSKPKIQALNVYRCDKDGTENDSGIYIAVAYQYSAASVNGKNTARMTLQYKRSDTDTYSTLLTGSAISANTTVKPASPTFSVDYQYDLLMTVEDWFGATTQATTELPSEAVIIDIGADGKSLGVGTTATEPGLKIGWPIVDQTLTAAATTGAYRTQDGLLLQWGNVNITPTAANTTTTVVVTFPQPYKFTPVVVVTPVSGVPQNLSVSVQRSETLTGDNTKAVAVSLNRSDTTATGVVWLAIGQAL